MDEGILLHQLVPQVSLEELQQQHPPKQREQNQNRDFQDLYDVSLLLEVPLSVLLILQLTKVGDDFP